MDGDKPYVTDNSNYMVDLYFQVPTFSVHNQYIKDGLDMKYGLPGRLSVFLQTVKWQDPIKDANAAAKAISALEGVVDHGLFLNMASVVIIAGSHGVTVQTKGA